MVSSELPHLAREVHWSVREDELGLAVAAGIPEDVPGRWVARVVLEADVELEFAERDPAALTAPSAVHDALLVRHQLLEHRDGLRGRLLFKNRRELDVLADGDSDPLAHAKNLRT